MSDTSTITKKGQVTIPARMRKNQNFATGKKVVFVEIEGGILIKPLSIDMRKLRGILDTKPDLAAIQTEIDKLRKEWTIG